MNRSRTLKPDVWISRSEDALECSRDVDDVITLHYHTHAERIHRYLMSAYGADQDDARDAMHDAFVRLFDAVTANEPIENAAAWVFTVARRLMLDRIKHHQHVQNYRASQVATGIPVSAATQEVDLLDREQRSALASVVRGLPQIERECFALRANNLTLREIGTVVGLDPRRVAEILTRACETVRARLPEWTAAGRHHKVAP